MALIPRVVPVQAKIRGLSTCEIVEVIVVCPALQMNFDPGANSPCKEADNTSAFHSGQWSMEDISSQIILASAATSISPDAITGALSLIFIAMISFESK
jgi:hypothetical protein